MSCLKRLAAAAAARWVVFVGPERLQALGRGGHAFGGALQGEGEDGGPFELLDQLAGLVLEARLDAAEAADARALGDGELALLLGAELLVLVDAG